MGVVYEAEQVSLGRHVALKVLPHQALANAKHKRRFQREARAAAKLHHTNIVPVFGVGEHEGLPYYVMQFIQGLGLDLVLEELKRMQPGAAPTSLPSGGEIRVSRRDVSGRDVAAAEVARSLMSGTFRQATDDDDEAAEREARLALVATVDAPTPDGAPDRAPDGASAPAIAATSSLSDSFTASSSSITLPGNSSAAGQRARKAQSYWQSVADIGRQVADALDYAHKQGILHRDVKPSNLLLDLRGTVWVTDFGLAKVADPGADNITQAGDILGTLRYMPPEAFDGKSDVRTDVYSLGLTMYELLAMRPAFDEKDRHKLIKQVTTGEPAALAKVNRDAPRDLVTIIHKAIDREPGRRYATAADMASDLQRFLDDEPIQARRQTPLERCVRWARHNPGIATLAGALAAVLFLATVASLLAASYFNSLRLDATQAAQNERGARQDADRARQRAADEARAARKAEEEARNRAIAEAAATALAQQERQRADDNAKKAEEKAEAARKAEDEAKAQLARAEWLVYAGKLSLAQADFETANGALALQYLDDCQWNLRGWEHRYLWTRINAKQTLQHAGAVQGVAFSPDGKRVLTGCRDSTMARIWDTQTGRELLSVRHGVAIRGVAYSSDGTRFITGAGDVNQPGEAKVWDAQTGRLLLTLKAHASWVLSVAFSADSKRIVTGDGDVFSPGAAKVWDAETGKNLQSFAHKRRVWSVAFSPDGKRIVSASGENTAKVWDAQTGAELLTMKGHTDEVLSAALTSDGKHLVTGSMDRTVKLWDAATGKDLRTFKGHTGWVRSAAFSPDDKRIVSSSVDTTVRVWDGATGQGILSLKGHAGDAWSVAFSPDGKRIVSSSEDRTAKVWDAERGQKLLTFHGQQPGPMRGLAFSPDNQRLAAGNCIWDAATGQKLLDLNEARGPRAFSPDGKRIVTGSQDKTAVVWDATTGKQLLVLTGHAGQVLSAAFSPDGKHIATAAYHQNEPGAVRLWDTATGREVLALDGLRARVWSVAFSPDGKRIVTGDDRTAKVWDVATGQEVFALNGHTHEVWCVAFSFDGKHIVTSCLDKMVRVWDAATGQIVRTLSGHTAGVWSVAFSRDGKRIFSGSEDGTVRVWDAGKGQELLTLKPHAGWVQSVAFSPDGKRLAAGSEGGTVTIWVGDKSQAPRNQAERVDRLKERLPGLLREVEQFTNEPDQVRRWQAERARLSE
jgi:WD40 repeat protein